MDIEILGAIKKQCKLTPLETARFKQVVEQKSNYPQGRTQAGMNISIKKVTQLISWGYLKKSGVCFTNNGKRMEDLYKPTI